MSGQAPGHRPPFQARKRPASAPITAAGTASSSVAEKAFRVPATTIVAASPSGTNRAAWTRVAAARSTNAPHPRPIAARTSGKRTHETISDTIGAIGDGIDLVGGRAEPYRDSLSAGSGCPICGGPLRPTRVEALDRLVTGEGPFRVVECPACEFGVTMPQLDEEASAATTRMTTTRTSTNISAEAERRAPASPPGSVSASAAPIAAIDEPPFRDASVAPGRILDVGCGSGDLLEHFARRGWDTYGIDPKPGGSDAAARRGAKVHHGTLRDQPWPREFFQAITFQHSLEHIVDPIERAPTRPNPACAGRPPWSSKCRIGRAGRGACCFEIVGSPSICPRHQQHFSPRALATWRRPPGPARCATSERLPPRSPLPTAFTILIAGHWTPGWKLWLSYALSVPLLPLVLLGDRLAAATAATSSWPGRTRPEHKPPLHIHA